MGGAARTAAPPFPLDHPPLYEGGGFSGRNHSPMNIPGLLSKSTISQMQCADTVSVRVLLHSVSNNGQARLRCRNRQYLFEKSHETGCHILDIPMSIWMHNVNPGRYRDQRSICDDFRELPGASFTIHIIGTQPAVESAPEAPPADPGVIAEFRRLLTALDAPPEVETAFDLASTKPAVLAGYVDGIIAALEEQSEEPPVEEPAADEAPDFSASSPYSLEEAQDLKSLHWKAFEKKYGMKKADFTAAKETPLV